MERNRGNHQGFSHEEIERIYPRPPFIKLFDPIGENGESEWQLHLRAGNALQSLFENPPGEYLIVSHGAFLNKVLHIIFGIKLQANFQGLHFELRNTGYTRLEYHTERNRWQMLDYIQPENLPTMDSVDIQDYKFTFVRHAESQGNVEKIFQGQSETPLSEMGMKQANLLGQQFKQNRRHFNYVFTSPQLRALQTTERICKPLDLNHETTPLLKEINNGKFAGLRGEEIEAHFPLRPDHANPYLPVGENGESWLELYLRGMEIVDFLVSHPPGRFLIVSHGAILNALIWGILGIPPQPSRRSSIFRFENTGSCELIFSPGDNLWWFHSLNASIPNIRMDDPNGKTENS